MTDNERIQTLWHAAIVEYIDWVALRNKPTLPVQNLRVIIVLSMETYNELISTTPVIRTAGNQPVFQYLTGCIEGTTSLAFPLHTYPDLIMFGSWAMRIVDSKAQFSFLLGRDDQLPKGKALIKVWDNSLSKWVNPS